MSDTVKITLALENVRGNPAPSLTVSVSEATTWSQDPRSEEDHVHHAQSGHEYHLSHCTRCHESHHWSWCTSSNEVQFHLFQSGKAYLQQQGHRAVLRYFRNHYYSSFGHSRIHQGISTSMGRPRVHNIWLTIHKSDHRRDRLWGQFRISFEDSNQEANPAAPRSVTVSASKHQNLSAQLKKKLTHWRTCLSSHGALFVREPKVSNTITNHTKSCRVSFNPIIASTNRPAPIKKIGISAYIKEFYGHGVFFSKKKQQNPRCT